MSLDCLLKLCGPSKMCSHHCFKAKMGPHKDRNSYPWSQLHLSVNITRIKSETAPNCYCNRTLSLVIYIYSDRVRIYSVLSEILWVIERQRCPHLHSGSAVWHSVTSECFSSSDSSYILKGSSIIFPCFPSREESLLDNSARTSMRRPRSWRRESLSQSRSTWRCVFDAQCGSV